MMSKAQQLRSADRPTASLLCPHQGRFENEPPGSLM